VHSLEKLTNIYYNSVGRNGLLLLNLPVDTRGLVHEADAARLKELRATLDRDFATNFAVGKKASASNERGSGFQAKNTIDGNPDTYWATTDGTKSARLEIDLGKKTSISRLVLQEQIRLGQRVTAFKVLAQQNGKWIPIAEGTTIGYKRILRFAKMEAEKLKIEIEGKAALCISEVGVY
jgi:alpha-L-fucosidase